MALAGVGLTSAGAAALRGPVHFGTTVASVDAAAADGNEARAHLGKLCECACAVFVACENSLLACVAALCAHLTRSQHTHS
jgi:hypothetical protein